MSILLSIFNVIIDADYRCQLLMSNVDVGYRCRLLMPIIYLSIIDVDHRCQLSVSMSTIDVTISKPHKMFQPQNNAKHATKWPPFCFVSIAAEGFKNDDHSYRTIILNDL